MLMPHVDGEARKFRGRVEKSLPTAMVDSDKRNEITPQSLWRVSIFHHVLHILHCTFSVFVPERTAAQHGGGGGGGI